MRVLLVFLGVRFGVLAHLFDFVLGDGTGVFDADLGFFARAQVFGGDADDAVGVDVELDFDLRHAARGGGNAFQVEAAELAVIAGHGAFALVDDDRDGRLVVGRGAEDLLAFGGDGGVAFDELGEDAAFGFDAQRERGDVEQQHILHFAGEHAALDGSADGDDFVGIHALVRLLAAEHFLDEFLHLGDAGGTADEHDFVDIFGFHLGVFESSFDRPAATFEERIFQLFELAAGDVELQVLGAAGIGGDERQVDIGASWRS